MEVGSQAVCEESEGERCGYSGMGLGVGVALSALFSPVVDIDGQELNVGTSSTVDGKRNKDEPPFPRWTAHQTLPSFTTLTNSSKSPSNSFGLCKAAKCPPCACFLKNTRLHCFSAHSLGNGTISPSNNEYPTNFTIFPCVQTNPSPSTIIARECHNPRAYIRVYQQTFKISKIFSISRSTDHAAHSFRTFPTHDANARGLAPRIPATKSGSAARSPSIAPWFFWKAVSCARHWVPCS